MEAPFLSVTTWQLFTVNFISQGPVKWISLWCPVDYGIILKDTLTCNIHAHHLSYIIKASVDVLVSIVQLSAFNDV